MKYLQATKVWVLICSTLAITRVAATCKCFQTPYIKAPTIPWTNSISNQNKEWMTKPTNPELTCISANPNIFNIVQESKEHCKGQDYRVTFYLQIDDDYNKLDSFLIDKHLFHNVLMKYSDWSLTSEKLGSINNKQATEDNNESKASLISSGDTKWPSVVRLIEYDKIKDPKVTNCICDCFNRQDTTNTQSDNLDINNDINIEIDEKYKTINSSYNFKYKNNDVTVPEYTDTLSSPTTINIYIDKNNKVDEYDIKNDAENNLTTNNDYDSYTEERRKNLKDYVKDHKISEIIDVLFNDNNLSDNKPIVFDCNGKDTDIVNSDVMHIYSTGDSAEYQKDVNGYFKNIDIDKTYGSYSNQVIQAPHIVNISDTVDNYNNEYVDTHIADNIVDPSVVRADIDGVKYDYYNLPKNVNSQATEPFKGEGTVLNSSCISLKNTSYPVNASLKPKLSPLDELSFTPTTATLKEPNLLILPYTEAENTQSFEYTSHEYSHNKNFDEIPCEYADKKTSDSHIQQLSPSFAPNYEVHSRELKPFQEESNIYSPDNSNTIQMLTSPLNLKTTPVPKSQKPFYAIDKMPFVINPEDYPITPQNVYYSKPIPTEDTEFYVNPKISDYNSVPSDTETVSYHIPRHDITQEESTKPCLNIHLAQIASNKNLPTVVPELEMPVSELSPKLQPVANIIPSQMTTEPLLDYQISKPVNRDDTQLLPELSPITELSPIIDLIPNYETIHKTSSSSSTTSSPSTDKTHTIIPFIKMAQLSMPQEDASLPTIISFSQSDINSQLPVIIENNEPAAVTYINPDMASLPQTNINLKTPKIISSYGVPSPAPTLNIPSNINLNNAPFSLMNSQIPLKAFELPPSSVNPVLPTSLKPLSSFYSSNLQSISHIPLKSWLSPASNLQKYKLSTPNSDIPILPSIAEAIPHLSSVYIPTISTTTPNLQPMFTPLNIANPQTKIYTKVPNALPEIISTASKEPLMIYPLPVNEIKPVRHVEEPKDYRITIPLQRPTQYIYSQLDIASPPAGGVPPKNQITTDTFETKALPVPGIKMLWAQKYIQPIETALSPFTAVPSTPWQSFPKIRHLLSQPSQMFEPSISPSLLSPPVMLSDSDLKHFLPLPEIGTVPSSITQSLIYTSLPENLLSEVPQFIKQHTTTLTAPLNNEPINYLQKLNNYAPNLQKLPLHMPSPTGFLGPMTKNYTKLFYSTTQAENGQLQQQISITEPVSINNFVSNVMTATQQPTKTNVEPNGANQWTKENLPTSPTSKAVPLLNKIFPITSPSSVLESPIYTYASPLSKITTAIPSPLTYHQLETPYASKLKPILSYTDVKKIFQAIPPAVLSPTKSHVTPVLSTQPFDLISSSLSYPDSLVDKRTSLDSSLVPISSPLSTSSLNNAPYEKVIEINPESYFKPTSEFSKPMKDILQPKVTASLPFQRPLPNFADSLTPPYITSFQEYLQESKPNLLKTNATYTTLSKSNGRYQPVLPSTVLAPHLNPVKTISEVVIPLANKNIQIQPVLQNTLSGFQLPVGKGTPLFDNEIISLKPTLHPLSTVSGTLPAPLTTTPPMSSFKEFVQRKTISTSPALTTVAFTPPLNEFNRQTISPLRWSESLPIYNESPKCISQSITLDNLPVSPETAYITPLMKEEYPLLSSVSTTMPQMALPVTTPIYPTSLLTTHSLDKASSALMYRTKHPSTSPHTHQAYSSLLSPIIMTDTKLAGTVKPTLAEPPNFVTPLSYTSKPVYKDIPEMLPYERPYIKETLPHKFIASNGPLPSITYNSPSEKGISKETPFSVTPYIAPCKNLLASPSPVETILEAATPLANIQIATQPGSQATPLPSFPSLLSQGYATPLLKPTSFLVPFLTSHSGLPLEETKSPIIPTSYIGQEGKFTSALKPSESRFLPLKDSPQLNQDIMHGLPLSPLSLTLSKLPQSKQIVSSQQFSSPHIQEAVFCSKYPIPPSPLSATYSLKPIPENLKPLKLNNVDSPNWRWSDTFSPSPIISTNFLTPIPLSPDYIETSASDLVSKPYPHSYLSTYKPVYTGSQNLPETLSSPTYVIPISPVKSVEPLLQSTYINKVKYKPLHYYPKFSEPALYASENIPQLISPLQPAETLSEPTETLYSNYPQSLIMNRYTPNLNKWLSQIRIPIPIHTDIPSLWPLKTTTPSLPYIEPQFIKPDQWLSSTMIPVITPTSANIDSHTQLPLTYAFSKITEPVTYASHYPIKQYYSVPVPRVSISSSPYIFSTQNRVPPVQMLPYSQIAEPRKLIPVPSGYDSYAGNVQTPTITSTVYPTSTSNDLESYSSIETLSYPNLKRPTVPCSNSNTASYLPVAKTYGILKPESNAINLSINTLELNTPTNLLAASEYKSPYLYQSPVSPPPAFDPMLNSIESPSLKEPFQPTLLKDSDLIFLPSTKLTVPGPCKQPLMSPLFASIKSVSPLKQNSQYFTPLQNVYPFQSISNSLPDTLPASIQPILASDVRQFSSPHLSQLSRCKYTAFNLPAHVSPISAPLVPVDSLQQYFRYTTPNALQYTDQNSVPTISASPLSQSKFYGYKPIPYQSYADSVLGTSSHITQYSELSSITSTEPSLTDSAVSSSWITSQTPLLQTIGPESSHGLSAKPLLVKHTSSLQYEPSKTANVTPNSSTTLVPLSVSSAYSVISNTYLSKPPSRPLFKVPVVNAPIIPKTIPLLRNHYLKPISSPTYINTPVNINIAEKKPSPTFVSSIPSFQSIYSLPSTIHLEVGTPVPIVPTVPSLPVETSLPKEIFNTQSGTTLNPQKLMSVFKIPVSSYFPVSIKIDPLSSSQANLERHSYAIPYFSTVGSTMTSPVSNAPNTVSSPYSQYYDPHFDTMYSTPQNVGSPPRFFKSYSSPSRYQLPSYDHSICSLDSGKSSPKTSQYLSSTASSSSYTISQPVVSPLVPTKKPFIISPYKYSHPIKYGKSGLVNPSPLSKPSINVPLPIYSDILAAPTINTHNKPFTNYMPTYSMPPSLQTVMSSLSSPPAKYPSQLSAIPFNAALPSVIPCDFTQNVIPESPSLSIKLKNDNDFTAPVDLLQNYNYLETSKIPPVPTTLSTLLSKLNPLLAPSQLMAYPEDLSVKAPSKPDVLFEYTSPPLILPSVKQPSYYPFTHTAIDPKVVTDISTPPVSIIAINTNPYSNIALSPAKVSSPIIKTRISPFTFSEYITPEPSLLKPATNVVSPLPKPINIPSKSRLDQSLSYPQTSSSKTLPLPAVYVTPVYQSIYSKSSPSQYTPVSNYYTSYMPVKHTQLTSNVPVNLPLTYTPALNYKNVISTLIQSSVPSLPLSPVSLFTEQQPLITNKGFSSLPAIQSSQFSPYSPSSTEHGNIQLTSPEYTTQHSIPMNMASQDLSPQYSPFLNTKYIQPYYTQIPSIGKNPLSPLEPMQPFESLSTSAPSPINFISASSSNLPSIKAVQSLIETSPAIETISGTSLPSTLTNQLLYDRPSAHNFTLIKDNLNINGSVESVPYYYNLASISSFNNGICKPLDKINEKLPLYNAATYLPSLYSDQTAKVSSVSEISQSNSDTNYINDSKLKTYPLQPKYVSSKPILPSLQNQFYDNNLSIVSKSNNFIPLQNEMKTRLYNYVNNNEDIKSDVYNSNVDLSIPLGNILVAKKDCANPMVHNISPSIGLKMWPSNLKLIEAKLELKFKDVSVTNFQPVVNNLNTHDLNEVVKLVKNYIRNKYGDVVVLDDNNYLNNEYEVIQHCIDERNRCNLLWPVDTSCHSAKPILNYKGII